MDESQGKNDHWDLLVSELGATPPKDVLPPASSQPVQAEPLEQVEPPVIEEEEMASAAWVEPKEPAPPAAPVKPAVSRPTPAKRKTGRDWAALAGELGVEVPPEVFEEPQEEPPAAISPQRTPWQDEVLKAGEQEPEPEVESELDAVPEFFEEVEEVQASDEAEAIETVGRRAETFVWRDEEDEGEVKPPAVVEAAEEPGESEEERRGGRRRRKRSRRGRGEPKPERAEILGDLEDSLELPEDDGSLYIPAEMEEPIAETADEDQEEAPSRKRRRRRRRKAPRETAEETEAVEMDDEEAEPIAARVRDDDEDAEDEDDDDGHPDRSLHRAIPTWDEAVGLVIATNMESRSRNPDRRSSRRR